GVVVYDFKSGSYDTIPPVAVDSVKTFDKTLSFQGWMKNAVPLPLSTPTDNVFAGSNFTDLARAELFYDLRTYPARCATTFYKYDNGGKLYKGCSGMLVAPNF